MSRVALSPTSAIPLTGLGLWKIPPAACADTVYAAIKNGYRLLDGAHDYANEKECGAGVARAIADGLVTRDELFVVSKLWNTNHAQENVLPALKASLADWGLEYFDLYLVHFPISLKHVPRTTRAVPEWTVDGAPPGRPDSKYELESSPMHLTWAAMEAAHDAGLARNIGISNFRGALVMDLMGYARVKPAVLQVEMHPYLLQQPLIDLCAAYGIHMMAYSSFGPASWIELSHPGVAKVSPLFEHPVITSIAAAHGATPGQVLLRWATQRGVTVIPKSLKEERLVENLANEKVQLSEEEIAKISGLDVGFRFNDPAGFDPRMAIFA